MIAHWIVEKKAADIRRVNRGGSPAGARAEAEAWDDNQLMQEAWLEVARQLECEESCSEDCKDKLGKPPHADAKWHHLDCPNHNISCCPGITSD